MSRYVAQSVTACKVITIRKTILTVMTLVIINCFAVPTFAHACSCMEIGSPIQALQKSDLVFVGDVLEGRVESTAPRPHRVFLFKVVDVIKGRSTEQVEVSTGLGDADCGYNFAVGRRYLVYAYAKEWGAQTGICSATKEFSAAVKKEIDELKGSNPG